MNDLKRILVGFLAVMLLTIGNHQITEYVILNTVMCFIGGCLVAYLVFEK